MDGEYFPSLYAWFKGDGAAYLTHFFKNYAIPPEFDFTKEAHRAPLSSSTAEAIEASVGPVEQEIMEAVAEGRIGFRGGWISSIHLSQLLEAKRLSARMPNRKRGKMLEDLGFVPHPCATGADVLMW